MSDFPVIEKKIHCPFCAEAMTIVIDLSAGGQSYVEDCEICCRPMQITFDSEEGELLNLDVDAAA